MNKAYDRTKNTDKFSEIAKTFGETDLRFGQAIVNVIQKNRLKDQDISLFLYNIENDHLEKLLLDEMKNIGMELDGKL